MRLCDADARRKQNGGFMRGFISFFFFFFLFSPSSHSVKIIHSCYITYKKYGAARRLHKRNAIRSETRYDVNARTRGVNIAHGWSNPGAVKTNPRIPGFEWARRAPEYIRIPCNFDFCPRLWSDENTHVSRQLACKARIKIKWTSMNDHK